MTHLNKFTQPHLDEFPGANFRAFDDIPAAECSEAKIEAHDAYTDTEWTMLVDPGAFTGYNLVGKVCTIITNPGGNTGDFDITWHNNDVLTLDPNPGDGAPTAYNVHNGGELILTQTVANLVALTQSLGKAYTFANGRFYTDMTEPHMQAACSILYDPQIDDPLHP